MKDGFRLKRIWLMNWASVEPLSAMRSAVGWAHRPTGQFGLPGGQHRRERGGPTGHQPDLLGRLVHQHDEPADHGATCHRPAPGQVGAQDGRRGLLPPADAAVAGAHPPRG